MYKYDFKMSRQNNFYLYGGVEKFPWRSHSEIFLIKSLFFKKYHTFSCNAHCVVHFGVHQKKTRWMYHTGESSQYSTNISRSLQRIKNARLRVLLYCLHVLLHHLCSDIHCWKGNNTATWMLTVSQFPSFHGTTAHQFYSWIAVSLNIMNFLKKGPFTVTSANTFFKSSN